MTLVRFNPRRNFPIFHSNVSRVLDDFFPEITTRFNAEEKRWRPVVDNHENESTTFINVDLPGLTKEDISINVEENILTISGERASETKTENENYFRRERFFGKFQREFTLPSSVDYEKIKADYKDGVLKIEVPKPEETKPKTIEIH